jgi:hypothetical protein
MLALDTMIQVNTTSGSESYVETLGTWINHLPCCPYNESAATSNNKAVLNR